MRRGGDFSLVKMVYIGLPLGLLLLVIFQQQQLQSLKAERDRFAQELVEYRDVRALRRYRVALRLAQAGNLEGAIRELQELTRELPDAPLARRTKRDLEALKVRPGDGPEKRRVDLEKLLYLPPHDRAGGGGAPRGRPAVIDDCRELEAGLEKYYGGWVRVTDEVRRIHDLYAFVKCPQLTISTERMSPAVLSALAGKFGKGDTAVVTLTGEFNALSLFAE